MEMSIITIVNASDDFNKLTNSINNCEGVVKKWQKCKT